MTDHHLQSWLTATLHEIDYAGCSQEAPEDEYQEEASLILEEAETFASPDDVQRTIHRVMVSQFDDVIAGAFERYEPIAQALWKHLQEAT